MPKLQFTVKRVGSPTIVKKDDEEAARERFEKGLKELQTIDSKEKYRAYVGEGKDFSIKSFRIRNGIGNTSMRKTNSDLFTLLLAKKARLIASYSDKPGGKPGRPKGSKRADEVERYKARIAELEQLLEARTADVVRYLSMLQKPSTIQSK